MSADRRIGEESADGGADHANGSRVVTTGTWDVDKGPVKCAPSILAADFARLGDQVGQAEHAGADRIHVDVMGGHFGPTFREGR
jgi:Ribulose-phosphate 3 epimerase family